MASTPAIGSSSSALDVQSLVSQLMAAESRPLTLIQSKTAGLQTKISALGQVKSSLTSLNTAVTALASPSALDHLSATSSGSEILASLGTGAQPGVHQVSIQQLAQSQALVTRGQTSPNSSIGSGTIQIQLGSITGGQLLNGHYEGASFQARSASGGSVTIDSSNNSLTGIRDAINRAGLGVTASVVNDGGDSPYRLMLTGQATGSDQSLSITVSGDAALSSLLSHDPSQSSGQNLTQTRAAQSAQLTIDGLAVQSQTNRITGAIPGLDLTLNASTSAPIQVTVARDQAALKADLQSFVTAFNSTAGLVKTLTAYDLTSKKGATLFGESALKGLVNQLRGLVSGSVNTGLAGLERLSDIGIVFQSGGVLSLDSTKLDAALKANPAGFTQLLANANPTTGTATASTGLLKQIQDLLDKGLASDGLMANRTKTLNTSIDKLQAQSNRISTRLDAVQKNYQRQYSALNVTLTNLTNTSNALTQQLASLSGSKTN